GDELGIPPLAATTAAARVRALYKYAGLKTFVAELIGTTFASKSWTWVKATQCWIKRYKFELTGVSGTAAKNMIIKRISARDAPASQARHTYEEAHFEKTRRYLKDSLREPLKSGFTWLARLRLSAVWTRARAQAAGLLPQDLTQ
ncbi:hypothetical protein GGH92_008399, partial [Coemansia sp. RSA 2673]